MYIYTHMKHQISWSSIKSYCQLLPILAHYPFCWIYANSADPDQTPPNVVSDQGLHCLFAKSSIILNKNEKYHTTSLKSEMDCSI